MSARRLRVGDPAVCRTGDHLDGLIFTVTHVHPDGYDAAQGLESASFFAEGELEPIARETSSRQVTSVLVAALVVAIVLALGLLSVWGA